MLAVKRPRKFGWEVGKGQCGAEGAIQTGAFSRSARRTACAFARAASTSGPRTMTGLALRSSRAVSATVASAARVPAAETVRSRSRSDSGSAVLPQSS